MKIPHGAYLNFQNTFEDLVHGDQKHPSAYSLQFVYSVLHAKAVLINLLSSLRIVSILGLFVLDKPHF